MGPHLVADVPDKIHLGPALGESPPADGAREPVRVPPAAMLCSGNPGTACRTVK